MDETRDISAIAASEQEHLPARSRLVDRLRDYLQTSRLSWPVRLALLYAGVVVPVLSHMIAFHESPDAADWQSGSLDDKLSFTLSAPASIPFYPLMLYPMVCLVLLLFREKRFADRALVRFGILTGIPVAAWYAAMLGLVVTDTSELLSWHALGVPFMAAVAIAAPLAAWGVLRLLLWARRTLNVPWVAVVGGLVVLYIVFCFLALATEGEPTAALFWPAGLLAAFCFFSLLCGPSWALGSYLFMSLRLLACSPRPLRYGMFQLMAVLSWLAAFLAACRWSVVKSLEIYATLPTEPPGDCYVASAAAHGHRMVVRSQLCPTSAGTLVPVNRQLRVLKAAELTILALAPALHRQLRNVYDRLGPLAARHLANPYLADVVYLLLKPVEWCSWLVLVWLLGPQRQVIGRLYTSLPRL
jgi:hypothetical protein